MRGHLGATEGADQCRTLAETYCERKSPAPWRVDTIRQGIQDQGEQQGGADDSQELHASHAQEHDRVEAGKESLSTRHPPLVLHVQGAMWAFILRAFIMVIMVEERLAHCTCTRTSTRRCSRMFACIGTSFKEA